MSQAGERIGQIGWVDLTVDDAEALRDFYAAVVGWRPEPVDMGGYADFNMCDPAGQPKTGVCHRRRGNERMPSGWMVYFTVHDLDARIARCRELGGEVLVEPSGSQGRTCVIRDPSGAVCALYEVDGA